MGIGFKRENVRNPFSAGIVESSMGGFGTESTDPASSMVSVEISRGDYRELIFTDVEARCMAVETASARKSYRRLFQLFKENFFSFSNRMGLHHFFLLANQLRGKDDRKKHLLQGKQKK
jgi:hypothetical protein